MKLFECQSCGQLLYFENTRCERCGHVLGYLSDAALLSALAEEDSERWRPLIAPEQVYRFCANAAHEACNWLVPADGPMRSAAPAASTAPSRTLAPRSTCCAGSVWRQPSTSWSTACCGSACRW